MQYTTIYCIGSMVSRKSGDVVIPGDEIGQSALYECGLGSFESVGGILRASIAGIVAIENIDIKPRINVISTKEAANSDAVIEIGDVVLARVVRISINFANVEILSVGESDRPLRLPPKAVIRREDIRLTDLETLVVHECFRPGDIVRAVVISLGDARQYFLSTADVEYGVVTAIGEKSGQRLVPVSARVRTLCNATTCYSLCLSVCQTGNGGLDDAFEGAQEGGQTNDGTLRNTGGKYSWLRTCLHAMQRNSNSIVIMKYY